MKLYEVSNTTLYKDYVIEWIEYHKNFIKESTYANYKNIVFSKLIIFFGEFEIKDINKKIIQSFILDQKVSVKYIKDCIIVLKQSFNYLFENDIIEEFIFSKLKYKKENKKKIEFLNKIDYIKLKNYCVDFFDKDRDIKFELAILISMSTGMRIGEVCGLKFKDINFDEKILMVNRTLQRIYTPDEKTKIIIGSPKSSSSNRMIPITNDLFKCLSKLEYNEDWFVIRNNKYTEPRCLRTNLNNILKKLDIKKIKFHSLRHTFATNCISSGVDVKTTSELLGHANADMTLNIYTHTTMEQKTKAIEIIQNI